MHRVFAFLVLLSALLLFALSLHASNQSPSGQDHAGLVIAKCANGGCHDVRRICFRLGKTEASYWPATVAKMQRAGAKIDESQAKAVADWLAAAPAGAKPLCP